MSHTPRQPASRQTDSRTDNQTRRTWLAMQATQIAVFAALPYRPGSFSIYSIQPNSGRISSDSVNKARFDPEPLEMLTQRAVDAARTAGAQYADARFTRTTSELFNWTGDLTAATFAHTVGLGVRVLIDGYWGFAASPRWTTDDAVQIAQRAVSLAKEGAKGPARSVELGKISPVTGRWTTPIRIEPFTQISIEEKLDFIRYVRACASRVGVEFDLGGASSVLQLVRQERVLATSDGSLVSQTLYESGGGIACAVSRGDSGRDHIPLIIRDIAYAGKGWELFQDAKLPEQFAPRREEAIERYRAGNVPVTLGRYTVVCDGATMASIVDKTLGVATQLDRALGYEANAEGTSFITDPLAMVGNLPIAVPGVTLTANRSAPAQLATVQWDDEGVVPQVVPLIQNGVLVDFQTTREQAAWLAPYYHHVGKPVQSHGYAAAQDAHYLTIQHPPNLEMAPSASATTLADLVASVPNGLLLEGGVAWQMDAQARNGLLTGPMRKITNGRLGPSVQGGALSINTQQLWKHIRAIGGSMTVGLFAAEADWSSARKGQPKQRIASHTVRAPAAILTEQSLINPTRKA